MTTVYIREAIIVTQRTFDFKPLSQGIGLGDLRTPGTGRTKSLTNTSGPSASQRTDEKRGARPEALPSLPLYPERLANPEGPQKSIIPRPDVSRIKERFANQLAAKQVKQQINRKPLAIHSSEKVLSPTRLMAQREIPIDPFETARDPIGGSQVPPNVDLGSENTPKSRSPLASAVMLRAVRWTLGVGLDAAIVFASVIVLSFFGVLAWRLGSQVSDPFDPIAVMAELIRVTVEIGFLGIAIVYCVSFAIYFLATRAVFGSTIGRSAS